MRVISRKGSFWWQRVPMVGWKFLHLKAALLAPVMERNAHRWGEIFGTLINPIRFVSYTTLKFILQLNQLLSITISSPSDFFACSCRKDIRISWGVIGLRAKSCSCQLVGEAWVMVKLFHIQLHKETIAELEQQIDGRQLANFYADCESLELQFVCQSADESRFFFLFSFHRTSGNVS